MLRILLIIVFSVSMLCASAQSRRYEYDKANRLTRVITPSGFYVEYRYDNNGNRTQIVTGYLCYEKPIAKITQIAPTILCVGDSVILRSDTAYKYKWSTGDTTREIKVKQSGSYKVVVSARNGCADSVTQQVTFNAAPSLTIISSPQPICVGSVVTLTATGATSYSWTGVGLQVTTGASVRAILPTTSNKYTVIGSNVSGCSSSKDITISATNTVLPQATISKSPCSNSSITFTTNFTNGGTNPQIQWQLRRPPALGNWIDTVGETKNSFTLPSNETGTQVRYKLTTNAVCASPSLVYSDSAVVNCVVTAIPIISGLESFIISPNPSTGLVTIQIKVNTIKTVSFRVLNLNGQLLKRIPQKKIAGIHIETIQLNVPSGLYQIETTIDKKRFSEKIIIQR